MADNTQRVLVIDDDEVVLMAIADLLEAAGFVVLCQSTPAGAADIAAADPKLVAAIVDLNMPIMRGDNVARMFLSRASLRDLPLIVVSGESPDTLAALRERMPHLKVVAKDDMEGQLVAVLRSAVAERTAKGGERSWGSEPSADSWDKTPVGREFFERLARELPLAREVWQEARAGKHSRVLILLITLRGLQKEADQHSLFQVTQLLRGIEQLVGALQRGRDLRANADRGVERAFAALAGLTVNRQTEPTAAMDAIIDSLRASAGELPAK